MAAGVRLARSPSRCRRGERVGRRADSSHPSIATPLSSRAELRSAVSTTETDSHASQAGGLVRSGGPEYDLTLVVEARRSVADGVLELTMLSADGRPLPPWTPGAHIELHLPNGLVRHYSLCGDPEDGTAWRISVLRESEGRGGSAYVHDLAAVGDVIEARGPRNRFTLEPAARYRFIAGGIGITPILPMVVAADAAGVEWTLTYGGRTRASMAYLDELLAYGDRVVIHPQDECGMLDLDAVVRNPSADTLVYCCGPGVLLDAVRQRCATWPTGALHIERFRADPAEETVLTDTFEVEIASTGTRLSVPPGSSVLEVLEHAGVDVLSSCREGICGTCETGVVAGEVDHRDALLTDAERAANTTMFVCVSRARTRSLTLDL
ncbi:oxidoreductase [Rhodococcus sp. BP-149]|nr:oxidoreductase [Rhodococcus sp. BP-288]MBY6696012.1 oxidoreductase [Rhodococcus sp. BP-188]MBY6700609.1 oxidoreductase [Rhodococcus sp. BP-285]MBY6705006.1 oxidoreductase [Rhodococcus sp. BP-283]MBY6713734.1 oxidoreductase [Rhodococcus sp. BP-160]MBY6715649.1 oxidoreductase [Rhodococcus sp. BP-110]MBY6722105.1 oxidoreductase [Rhodococcus sp. BP-142]MBY6726631.1 oxidoreductase [Rhodococcus sp. BP-149]MBY6730775.1 oxidoreductase [Rhodococcus sp. BP-107]